MLFEFIATTFLKLLEEGRSPGGFAHLVAVIKESTWIERACAFEGCLDMFEVVGHSTLVEVVDDQSFATRGSTLHLHHTIADIDGNNAPLGLIDILDFLLQCLLLHLVGRGLAHGGQHGEG